MKDRTRLIEMGCGEHIINGEVVNTINPPLYRASTILFKDYDEFNAANHKQHPGITYGTDGLPNQTLFETALAKLEGAAVTHTFQSGISAINNALLAFLKTGDHLIICDNVYGPTARFCRRILPRYNVSYSVVDGNIGANIEQHIKPNTRVIFLESPGSITFELQDIPAICEIAKRHNIVTMLDNTWATPLYFDAFAHGVDVSLQSVTKYIAGHSDVLLGTASINQEYAEEFGYFYHNMELFADTFDCSMALRGLKTLSLRLDYHGRSALSIARWLEQHSAVNRVFHPALEQHPQHNIWKRDFTGSSGIFSFTLKNQYTEEQIATFVNAVALFGLGFSWGGYKSLLTIGNYDRPSNEAVDGQRVVRLNIGLEDSDDLIADLAKALDHL